MRSAHYHRYALRNDCEVLPATWPISKSTDSAMMSTPARIAHPRKGGTTCGALWTMGQCALAGRGSTTVNYSPYRADDPPKQASDRSPAPARARRRCTVATCLTVGGALSPIWLMASKVGGLSPAFGRWPRDVPRSRGDNRSPGRRRSKVSCPDVFGAPSVLLQLPRLLSVGSCSV